MKRNHRQKERVDLISFREKAERGKWKITMEERDGIRRLQIILPLSQLKENKIEAVKKKIARRLRGYAADRAVVMADPRAAAAFGMEDILYEAGKQELIRHSDYIFRQMPGTRILLVMGETAKLRFTRKELLELLLRVKDRYRDISIFGRTDETLSRLAEYIYDEWGVVISFIDKAQTDRTFFDAALFLAAEPSEEDFHFVSFGRGYVLPDSHGEFSGNFKRVAGVHSGKKKGILYSGLVYWKAGKVFSYPMALNIAYQNPNLYKELNISFIDIYELECYNKIKVNETGGVLD